MTNARFEENDEAVDMDVGDDFMSEEEGELHGSGELGAEGDLDLEDDQGETEVETDEEKVDGEVSFSRTPQKKRAVKRRETATDEEEGVYTGSSQEQ